MLETKPAYYDRFSCLCGACPDTCCGMWQVVIDPDALALYQSTGGPLGERLRAALTEQDGEPCFAMEQGRCAMLTPEGLCAIQKELGEAALCKNCARYPRFRTQIGARRERGLNLSCPEAARLILTSPFALQSEETDEPLTDFHELSPELILTLRALRSHALSIAGDQREPFGLRCARILLLCAPADRAKKDRELAKALEAGLAAARGPVQPATPDGQARCFAALRRVMAEMEYLQPAFRSRMDAALTCQGPDGLAGLCPARPEAWERLLCYGIYKYFPRAAFDRSIYPTAAFCVTLPLLLRLLLANEPLRDDHTLCRLAWTLSRELEHSDRNMALLFRAFRRRGLRCDEMAGVLASICD